MFGSTSIHVIMGLGNHHFYIEDLVYQSVILQVSQ